MIDSFFRNAHNWLRGIWNGATGQVVENAILPSAPPSFGAEETENRPGHDSQNPSLRPEGRSPRKRRPGRRAAGKSHSSSASAAEELPPIEAPPEEPWNIVDFSTPCCEGKTRFHDLDLPDEIMHAIHDLGFQYCTPVQTAILPKALLGEDAAGRAQTGTGKSAVFLISILTHLLRNPLQAKRNPGSPRALILVPTRELAIQVERDCNQLGKYTPYQIVALFGGMDYEKQRHKVSKGPADIIVATPGRLLDFKRQGDLHLNKIEILIIDEADRMLDMGFIPDVQQIIQATPRKTERQTMLFSATLTPQVTRFASQWTRDPVIVEIEPENVAVDTVEQLVYITTMEEKFPVLYNIITKQNLERVIVFGNRRDQTRRLTERFKDYGISSALLSGEVDQRKRIKTLEDFRAGKVRVLVATDVASRGLHIEGVSHVVNYNLPLDPEDYVHRIGRTGRAGASGISVSFASEDDSFQIPGIEKLLGHDLECLYPADELLELPPPPNPHRSRDEETPSHRPRQGRGPFPKRGRGGSSRSSDFKRNSPNR